MSAGPVLAAIHVYPLKSAAGIASASWPVDDFGLQWDRRWAVVGADGVCITQRTHPRLALVRTALAEGRLLLDAPGLPSLEVGSVERAAAASDAATIWDDTVAAHDVGAEAAEWISALLGGPFRIVYMPDATRRPVGRMPPDAARVSFADAYPFLVLTDGSLDALNRRLAAPLGVDRFRPNLVVAGAEPFAEDDWRRVRIGDIELSVVKPCARCVLTTVNQRTGVAEGPEPLRTLATFRRRDGQVHFGQNAVHHGVGRLAIGEPVEVVA